MCKHGRQVICIPNVAPATPLTFAPRPLAIECREPAGGHAHQGAACVPHQHAHMGGQGRHAADRSGGGRHAQRARRNRVPGRRRRAVRAVPGDRPAAQPCRLHGHQRARLPGGCHSKNLQNTQYEVFKSAAAASCHTHSLLHDAARCTCMRAPRPWRRSTGSWRRSSTTMAAPTWQASALSSRPTSCSCVRRSGACCCTCVVQAAVRGPLGNGGGGQGPFCTPPTRTLAT